MIEFFDTDDDTWKLSRAGWVPEDIDWLNSAVGWPMYRIMKDAA